MEQAIFITSVESLKYVDSRYTRIYFGNEFCQRLIPSLKDLIVVNEFVLKHKKEFSFVTPYVTNMGIESLRPLLEYASNQFIQPEFVINDWGVLKILREEFKGSKLVLGRLLTKQKRGPRIINLKKTLPESAIKHFQGSNIDVVALREFLVDNGINRVELDNLLQGIAREPDSLRASLYYPFAYITTTRFCLTALSGRGTRFLRSIPDCNKECQKYSFKLNHKNMPVELFLKGNTQFFRNELLPDNLVNLNIDRIVYEPEIPV